ncbi:hypothetical protein [Streptomyces sp. NPDC097619]|uniref:hypothetical protein n=1 Tax=Streptomyces sp. NPDC097619 TaxID=3157228 RepID=UPI003316E26F
MSTSGAWPAPAPVPADPAPTSRAHDFAVPYVERDLGTVVAVFAQAHHAAGVTVSGECPGCHGLTRTDHPFGLPGPEADPGSGPKGLRELLRRFGGGGGEPEPDSAEDVLATEPLFCECGYAHPGQPADPVFIGCGASWRVAPPQAPVSSPAPAPAQEPASVPHPSAGGSP